MTQSSTRTLRSVDFREHFVDADGFHIRYLECGEGEPLVCFHGAGGLRVSPAHVLLAQKVRVILFEVPGFGTSPENNRSQSIQDLADTMAVAISGIGIERCALLGNSLVVGWRYGLPSGTRSN